jgi:hypothetical protein
MIPQKRYVDITSGVGGGAGVRLRDLISRVFTTNELVPPGTQREFSSADEVGTYFGTTSEEYKRAAFYFGWISKNITKANKLSFARWVNAAVASKIFGNTAVKSLATFTPITTGSLTMDLGSGVQNLTGVNLSAAASLTVVASTLQTAIRAVAAGGVAWTAATVTYDPVTNRFNVVSGMPAGAAPISVGVPGAGTDLAPLLGWTTASGGIQCAGSAIETLSSCLAASAELSNNFASFLFMPALTQVQVAEVASWNDTQNNMFMYLQRVAAADAAALSAALLTISGVGLTLAPLATEFPEMFPGMILAATDYTRRNAAQNYMYQQASLSPSVLTAANADLYDPLRVNYYGRTQAAGQLIDFYQRGVLMGGAQDAVDMNVYANEIWLKDAAAAAILSLLLSLSKVSANPSGRSQLIATLSTVIAQAVNNGTVSVGKTLNTTQKLYIAQLTGDPVAWTQVQNAGYWLDCVMQSYVTTDGRTEWKAVYTLIYSKDDTVRKVEGSHVLI